MSEKSKKVGAENQRKVSRHHAYYAALRSKVEKFASVEQATTPDEFLEYARQHPEVWRTMSSAK